ncbi:MAG: SUMF1/EgtB/PvdO family nonheme iron enzyme [Pirellulales bacterium]
MSQRQAETIRRRGRAAGTLALCLVSVALSSAQDSSKPSRPAGPRNIALDATAESSPSLFTPLSSEPSAGNGGLFVGVNKFTADPDVQPLRFAVNDAIEQCHLFVVELKLLPANQCVLALSGEAAGERVQRHLDDLKQRGVQVVGAEKSTLLRSFVRVRGFVRSMTGLLVVSFSSHGFTDKRVGYVMPSDGLRTFLEDTAIRLSSVEEQMNASQAGHRLLLVDACQERLSDAARSSGMTGGQAMTADFLELLKKPTGQSKLVSCDVGEYSYEHPELGESGHGVFTHAVLEALRGGAAADEGNVVRLSSVASYVSRLVGKWVEEQNGRRREGDPLKKQSPSYQGPEAARELPLAKKADDLSTLVASVRKQPLSGGFSAELRGSLVATLGQLDLTKEADRELVTATREFVDEKTRAMLFVPYLRGELERRQTQPSPKLVWASFTVRDGDDDNSPLAAGVRVELQWQASGSSTLETLGMATTDDQGRARLELKVGALPTSSGRFFARVSKGARQRDWTLTDFPTTFAWRLYLPQPGARLGDVTTSPRGMKLAYVPAGQFWMGSDETVEKLEAAGIAPGGVDTSDESPRHLVKITRPFYMGIHEVTIGQFAKFVADTGYRTEAEVDGHGGWGYDSESNSSKQDVKYSWRNTGWEQSDNHPVVNVSWMDAVSYCNWLSRQEGKSECFRMGEGVIWEVSGDGYRLPREAEWEYACRAGASNRFGVDDLPSSLNGFANVRDASNTRTVPNRELDRKYLRFTFDDRWPFTSPVREFKANAWGLHDMHGNVYEWCSDWYGVDFYRSSPVADPFGPSTGSKIVIRGGAWGCEPGCCRTANRGNLEPSSRNYDLGFRVAIAPTSEK